MAVLRPRGRPDAAGGDGASGDGVPAAPCRGVRGAPDGLVREAGRRSSQRAGEAGWAAWRAGLLGCPAGMAFRSAWRSCCSSSSVQAGGRVPLLCLGSWDALVPFKDCRRRCRRACADAWTTKQPAHGRASAGPLMRGSGQLMRGSALMRGSGRAADARFGSKRSFPTGRHLGCDCEGFNRLWPTRGPGGRIYRCSDMRPLSMPALRLLARTEGGESLLSKAFTLRMNCAVSCTCRDGQQSHGTDLRMVLKPVGRG